IVSIRLNQHSCGAPIEAPIANFIAKCGCVPLTRAALNSNKVRHEVVMNRDGTVNTDLDPMADYLLQIEASNKMHCASRNIFGFDGDRLLLKLTRRKAELYT
ncbi:expressed unknown protein (Partial), partial [Seminavis robusta]